MAVVSIVELEGVGSVELEYFRKELFYFVYGTDEERLNKHPPVLRILCDERLREISGFIEKDSPLKDLRYFEDKALDAFEEIERILDERKS
jgi:hypothetical protein